MSGQKVLWPIAAKNGLLSRIYYCFFDRSFSYEQQALLNAKLAYASQSGVQSQSSALLRRNIHRLEKGLIMQPRRDVFATDYIIETVQAYCRANHQEEFSSSELDWAFSVLTEYFSVVDKGQKNIAYAKAQFDGVDKRTESLLKPYESEQRTPHNVEFESLLQLTKARRSTRWFLDKPVASHIIEKVVSVATQAPSACNRQPFEFIVVDNDDLRKRVAKIPGGTTGFAENIPCLIAVVGDLSCYPMDRDRHVIYIDSGLASMQLMLAAETLGLSSCAINWPELEKLDRKVSKLLHLPQYKRVVMFIALGYAQPSGGIPYSDKKSPQQLIKYIKE